MKISAHLGFMWPEVPLVDRVFLAADAGFDGVDIPFPYDLPAKDLQRALLSAGLPLTSIASPPPNYTGGVRGFLADPVARGRFRHDLRRALRYAEVLGVAQLHLLQGPPQEDRSHVQATLRDNLAFALEMESQVGLLVGAAAETALDDHGEAKQLVEEFGDGRLQLRVDLSDLLQAPLEADSLLSEAAPVLGRVAVAAAPRAQPMLDDRSVAGALAALGAAGYDGWLSAAYPAAASDKDVLGWRALI